ncbi:MAG: TolC family protein, partial [Janthinobacterium lividum]
MTLPTALALALQSNPALSAARHETEALDASILQAGTRPNPTIALSIEDTRRETRESTVQFSQTLETGGKRQARIESAQRGRDVAAAGLRVRQAEVQADTITAFFEVLNAQQKLELAQEALELARRASSLTASRVT